MAPDLVSPRTQLTALLEDPAAADSIALAAIPSLLCQLSALHTALATRLLRIDQREDAPPSAEPDRLLTIDEAAAILGVTPKWLYRHKRLPFVRSLSRKALRVSEVGLRRWLAAKGRDASPRLP
jgi:hypothetical protein